MSALHRLTRMLHQQPLIKVYSHPRSGTHFLEHFLARNFYRGYDLQTRSEKWGHWSNRLVSESGNVTGRLFGSHYFPDQKAPNLAQPSIYIYRDGRAVAFSIWNTDNFLHKDWKGISFEAFLTRPLDWYGSPSSRASRHTLTPLTIVQHWERHVLSWRRLTSPSLLIIRYEDLVQRPDRVLEDILGRFPFLRRPEAVSRIERPVGLLPNKANEHAWREVFTPRVHQIFLDQLSSDLMSEFPGL